MAYDFTGNADHHITFDNGAFHHQQNQQPAAFNGPALSAHNAFAPAPATQQAQAINNGPPTPPTHTNSVGPAAFQHQQNKQLSQSQQSVTADFQPSLVAKAEPSPSDDATQARGGSGSGDDDLTPAQSRRKAQNRAAYVVIKMSLVLFSRRSNTLLSIFIDKGLFGSARRNMLRIWRPNWHLSKPLKNRPRAKMND